MSYEACPNANPGCKYFDTEQGCVSNEHHLYYPAYKYRSRIERRFRASQTEQMCMSEHDDLHVVEQPPAKPPRAEMVAFLLDQGIDL